MTETKKTERGGNIKKGERGSLPPSPSASLLLSPNTLPEKDKLNTRKRKSSAPPTKFQPEFLEEVLKLAALGVPHDKMAWYLGISPATFSRWKDRRRALREALKKGESMKCVGLLQAMFAAGQQDRNAGVLIFLAKNWLGMTDRQIQEHQGELAIRYVSHAPQEGTAARGAEEKPPDQVGKARRRSPKPPSRAQVKAALAELEGTIKKLEGQTEGGTEETPK